jgi:hypothetical protein
MKMRPRITQEEFDSIKKIRIQNNQKRVLCIGDLHEPFCLPGYFEFCKEIYNKYKCTDVVFIGDIIDNHFASYHETIPDSISGGDELELSITKIKKWYNCFPNATVIIGNHDRLIMRKAQTGGISAKWIKDYKDVLEVPNWNFVDRHIIDGVQYLHGEGGTARVKCKADMMSSVQGHLHTQAYTEFFVGANFRIFGMQVGCGIDHKNQAFNYAKYGKKPAIGCGVIIDGKTAINELMEL